MKRNWYQIVRRQWIDPFDQTKGLYPEEFRVYSEYYSSLKEVRKAIRSLKEKGRFTKYCFGYIKVKDFSWIWRRIPTICTYKRK